MSRRSHAMESFSHFMVALVGAAAILGAAAFAFAMFDDHGCTSGVKCMTPAEEAAAAHY